MRLIALAAIAAASVLATPALAQNGLYGHAEVEAGFEPDPAAIDMVAGGTIDLADAASGASLSGGDPACIGYVTTEPTFTLDYLAGDYPLIFFVDSEADTTMMIKDPTGRTTCGDDVDGSDDPIIGFGDPASGIYSIWIGNFEPSEVAATLVVTEDPSIFN